MKTKDLFVAVSRGCMGAQRQWIPIAGAGVLTCAGLAGREQMLGRPGPGPLGKHAGCIPVKRPHWLWKASFIYFYRAYLFI